MASDKMLGSFDQKSAPEDNDLLVEYDASASKVKNVKFGGVWNWIVKKLTSAVINELQTSSKNVVGAINELNSNLLRNSENIDSASDLAEDVLMKCGNGEIMLFTIQSTVSIDQGSPDGAGGFLLVYQSKAGSEYGIVVLFSYTKTIWMKIKNITWGKWVKTQLS